MIWQYADKADDQARDLADRHYSREKPGTRLFTPPGRNLVLKTFGAYWVTYWPYKEFSIHRWAGMWECSAFRREAPCEYLASDLIMQAVAATRWYKLYGAQSWRYSQEPRVYSKIARCDASFVTFVDPTKIRKKRDPGRCFLRAGFVPDGETEKRHYLAFVLPCDNMPEPEPPLREHALNLYARQQLALLRKA